jgi:hypothetical protein
MFCFFCKINAKCRTAIHIYLFHAGIKVEFIKVYIFLILKCAVPKVAYLKVTVVNVLRGKRWRAPSAL